MPDLSDAFAWIRGLIFRVDRLEGGAMLENASITSGRMRFIGGLLRVDSGGTVEIVGTLQVDGTSTVTGSFTVTGPWTLTGDGTITGAVSIEGPVTISGDVDLTGLMNVTGDIVVDGTGNIKIEGTGSIEVTGTGGIVVSEDGKITAGNAVLDPSSNGGSLKFTSGPEVYADGDELALYTGTLTNITMNGAQIFISGPGAPTVIVDADGIRLTGIDSATSTDGLNWLAVETGTGYLRRVAPGVGGPGAGAWEWPFPESTITWGFRPPDRPTHDGMDFAGPEVTGHPVRAAAQGVVHYAGWSDGYGWYVDLLHSPIDGQTVLTRYGHMLDPGPAVSTGDTVPKLGVLGTVGDTGASEGDHLHWELHLDGDPVDPAPFMAVHAA